MPTEQIEIDALNQIVQFLDGQRFTVRETCQVGGIKSMSMSNLLNKSNLELASPNPGRGRPRALCLIDVYSIVLMDRIMKVLKDYSEAAAAVNSLTFEINRSLMLGGEMPFQTDQEMKSAMCQSIKNVGEEFVDRDFCNPWFLEITPGQDAISTRDPYKAIQYSWNGKTFFNLTAIFAEVDKKLAMLKGFDFEKLSKNTARKVVFSAMAEALKPPPEDEAPDGSD